MKNKKKLLIIFIALLILLTLYFFSKEEKVQILNEYSPEGKLLGTNEYVVRNGDTIMHGKFINYNAKGNKIAEGRFIDGNVKGKCIYYYDSGKIEAVQFKSGKITNESNFYDENGLIENYTMYSDLGETTFIITFNEKIVNKYDGYSIWPIDQYKLVNNKQYGIKTGDILKIGDTIRYNYLVANIPYAKRTFKIETVGANNSKAKRIIKSKLPTEIIVEEVLTKKGLNRIQIVAQYQFEDKVTPTLNKVVSFDVYVN